MPPVSGDLRVNPLVEFLRTYGPVAAAHSIWDEHVLAEAQRTGTRPIEVPSARLAGLIENFRGDAPANVVLTGTAGDGKTWHCRQIFVALGGDPAAWEASSPMAGLPLGARRLVVVKDLSQFHGQPELPAIMARVLPALLGQDSTGKGGDEVFLLAANDGQLLRFWRSFAETHPEARQAEERIRVMLKEERTTDPALRLEMHNLSRQPHDQVFEDVVTALAGHPGWAGCAGCRLLEDGSCPIRRNLAVLSDPRDPGMRVRLRGLIRLAAFNDNHLPIRHVLLLAVNVILGVSGRDTALMRCATAHAMAESGEGAAANPYDNALGLNLPAGAHAQYRAFTVFADMGLGRETNNAVDGILVEAQPRARYDAMVRSDPVFGEPFDAVLWNRWLAGAGEAEFGYLRTRFARFSGFRNAVALLRGSEVEPHRKRRLTSRHLAPCGPAMLCADYGEARRGPGINTNINKDRRFFARGGELLFLMLNRSGHAEALEPLVKRRLLSPRSRWNRLAERLAPPEPEPPVAFDTGYLPLPRHRAYEALGRDWLSLLSLDALPDDHLSEPLMRLSALAVIRYIAERAAEVLGEDRPLMPIDAMGPEDGLRKLSRAAFARHRDMTRRAIERVADDFTASPAWTDACRQHNPTKAALELAHTHFGFKLTEPGHCTLDSLPHAIRQEALDNHEQHLGRVMGFYAEQIGLATRRGASRWYVLGDPLLEAVVLGNVGAPVEYEAFLALLHDRYGFVIGTEVAGRRYTHVNYQQVKANQQHLEDRLRMLGLLKRLSDDCAFVVNPFWTERT